LAIKLSAFVATSLDGFIARKDGNIDWLNRQNKQEFELQDFGYSNFINSIDVIIMGRKTFEQVLTFDKWPFEKKEVIVLGSKNIKISKTLSNTVKISKESPENLINMLSNIGIRNIYVDGGLTIQSFILAHLLDEITITLVPILLGDGISLFGPLIKDVQLQNLKTTTFNSGFVQIKYLLNKN